MEPDHDMDFNRAGLLLMIVAECAKHSPMFTSLSQVAVIELKALNSTAREWIEARTEAMTKAEAEIEAQAAAEAQAEAARTAPKAIPAKDLEPVVATSQT